MACITIRYPKHSNEQVKFSVSEIRTFVDMALFLMQCVKSKSVTNLAEATADPVLELDAGGNPVPAPAVQGIEHEEGAVGGILPPQPSANEPYPELPLPSEETP
jgi:hypothetical protein